MTAFAESGVKMGTCMAGFSVGGEDRSNKNLILRTAPALSSEVTYLRKWFILYSRIGLLYGALSDLYSYDLRLSETRRLGDFSVYGMPQLCTRAATSSKAI